MKIPMQNLVAQHTCIEDGFNVGLDGLLQNTDFVRGAAIKKFEESFEQWLGVPHVIAVANGTDALSIALAAMTIMPGDEVLVPAQTWISTASSVVNAGAVPVFVDIKSLDVPLMDEGTLSKHITARTVGIIPVHLHGLPCNMPKIMEFACENKLWVIEDCAQAHGATINGKVVGSFGDIGTFSFYPGKNLGAYGDAGCVVTGSELLANWIRKYANHGSIKKSEFEIFGINSRMDSFQAIVLCEKLKHLKQWNDQRKMKVAYYQKEISQIKSIQLPVVDYDINACAWHQFFVLSNQRDKLIEHLHERNISHSLIYKKSLNDEKVFQKFRRQDLPVSTLFSSTHVCLPLCPFITQEEQDYVCTALNDFI